MQLLLVGDESSPPREEHGYRRTECACAFCRAPCRHNPGGLDPADLPRLCPEGEDVFAWAEQHLRALTGQTFPTLVPARGSDGHCHWHFDGRCAVHTVSPYGCAFFDSHMPRAEVERRYAATVRARQADAAANGLYYRVWVHLCQRRLTGRTGDRDALAAEFQKIQRGVARNLRRAQQP